MSLPQNLGRLSAAITSDASLNIGVGVTPSGSFKLEVGTTSKFTGVATFGSTLSNGTYSYTLPSATGTFALVGGAGVGTVTSVAALTLGTSGTDLSSTVATGTTTPVITLNVPDASAANRGVVTTGAQTFAGAKTLTSALAGTSATFTGTSGTSSTRLTLEGTGIGWNNQLITNTGGSLWLGVMRDDGIAPFAGGSAYASFLGSSNATSLHLTTNSIPRLTLASGGNILIGTITDSGHKLDVNAGSSSIRFNGTTGDKLLLYNSGNNSGINGLKIDSDIYSGITFNSRSATGGAVIGGGKIVYNSVATGYGAASLGGAILLQADNAMQFSTGGDNVRLTIASGGNVGIGTTSPPSKFSVQFDKSVAFAGAAVYDSQAYNASNHGGTLAFGGTYTSGGAITEWAAIGGMKSNTTDGDFAGDLVAFTRPNAGSFTERMRITSGGSVGIGTSNPFGLASSLVAIVGSGSTYNFLNIQDTVNANNAAFIQFLNSAGSGIGGVTRVGTTNAVVFNTTSDRRLKKNIIPSKQLALPIINQIEIDEFDWEIGDRFEPFGVIAQDLHKIFPNAVTIPRKEEDSWMVDKSSLVPIMIKAIQEQQAQIEELKALIK